MGTTGAKSFNILVAFMRVLVVLTLVLFSACAPAYSWGEIDESGSYYCEGEGSCGAGWVWNAETKECVRAPMS